MHTNKNIRFTDSIAYAILMSQVFKERESYGKENK